MNRAEAARTHWEFVNKVGDVADDGLYKYDSDAARAMLNSSPWKGRPMYFEDVRISALALIKMMLHTRAGKNVEVMGLLQGKVVKNVIIVMDSFAIPVEGTETQVNAHAPGYEYMTVYMEQSRRIGRLESVIGWYHSHPGYGCWLSGVDTKTQANHQRFQDPFVAVVIDPIRSVTTGKVHLGAFRTFPEKHLGSEGDYRRDYQIIPSAKRSDFLTHRRRYYQLKVSYFKSRLDAEWYNQLWQKYYVSTLCTSTFLSNAGYFKDKIHDLSDKLSGTEERMKIRDMVHTDHPDSELQRATRDSSALAVEAVLALMTETLKDRVFNPVALQGGQSTSSAMER